MSFSSPPENADTYDSIIVTRIHDISAQQYDDIEAVVGGIDQLNIEYCCMWSGVMVLKLNGSTLYESGDIHLYIKNVLHDASALKKVDVLHVYTGLSGIAKC
jgi:hypothetical protein